MVKTFEKTKSFKIKRSAFTFVATFVFISSLFQPFAAFAQEVVIDDTNVINPPEQSVQAGELSNIPVVTEVTYSTSTPEILPTPTPTPVPPQDPSPTPTPDATSTPQSNLSSGTTPCNSGSDSTSTPASIDSGSNQPCDQASTTTQNSLLPNPGLENGSTTLESTTTLEIINTNSIDVKTVSTSTASSGLNKISAGDDIKNTHVDTGDVNVYANVLTVANVNLVNSQIIEMNDSFNKLAADLYFNQTELTPGERTQDLVSPICSSGNVTCRSMTTFKLTNQNNANVENNVVLNGNSGGNELNANGDVKDNSIQTGNVNAVVNVLNIVNTNAVNSRWTIVTFNVFGGWKGDLVMPSEMYFRDIMSIGADNGSDISQVTKVILNVNNTNQSDINNNVTVNTGTGGNTIETTPDAQGFEGDIKDSSVVTGNSQSQSDTQNISNITVFNSRWFLGLINIMGDWSGHVYSLPDAVAVDYNQNGFSFVSSPDPSVQAQLIAQLKDPVSTTSPAATLTPEDQPPADSQNQQIITTPINDGSASSTIENFVDLTNQNQAVINNNVTINATTGENSLNATGGDIRRNSITTGNSTALANILNFANTNLVNADLYVGLINIFGSWDGNIVFGYPDLSVTQTVSQSQIPAAANQPVKVKVSFANNAPASIAGSHLEWKFDPAVFEVDSVDSTYQYTQVIPGQVIFDLGNVAPNKSDVVNIQLKTLAIPALGAQNNFFAHIFGIGAEKNQDNNQNIVTVLTATTTPTGTGDTTPPAGGNTTPGGSGGSSGSSGGSSSGGGGSSGGSSSGGGGSSGGGSSSSSSSGGAGGGAQSSNNNTTPSIGVLPNLIRVYKINNAYKPVKPGDKVSFTVTVDNDGNNTINNIVVYDTLRGPDGAVINTQNYSLGKMLSRQEATFNYDLIISETAEPGTYTNTAYAQGLDESLHEVRNLITALSSFTVIGTKPGQSNKDLQTKSFTRVESKVGGLNETITATSHTEGEVLGDACVQPAFVTDLKFGIKSTDVKTLAQYLNSSGYALAKKGAESPGKESTIFGNLLRNALIKFQKANKIKEKGVVGAETRAKLNALFNVGGAPFCPPPPFKFSLILRQGSSNDEVTKLQKWLNSNGFVINSRGAGSPGQETKAFGSLTKNALMKLQKIAGIKGEDGTTGPNTRAYINSKLTMK